MAHSSVSPSGSDRFFGCPGSVAAQAAIDLIEPSNPAALEGLAIHELAAKCLIENLDPHACIGETVEVEDNYGDIIEFTVNEDFANAVQMYRDEILGVLKEHNMDQKALQVETKFTLPEVDKKAKGTTDCSFIASDTLHVFDLKGGRGVIVSPVENKQCMYYALRPYLDAKMFITKVIIWIIQPRAREGEFVKKWETTPARLEEFIKQLKRAIALTELANPDFNTGTWCQWCKAQGSCSVANAGAIAMLQESIPQIEQVFPKVTELTPQQIGNALPTLEVIKGFINNLMGYAFTLASKGQDIPNYSLARGKKNRQFRDEAAVIAEFSEHGDKLYAQPKLKTPAQLEKVVGKGALEEHIFVPEGDLKLVPTKEAQEAISRKVEDVFKDVDLA